MLTSDLLNAQVPSRTSFLTIVSNTPFVYTPTGPVELTINYRDNAGSITVNGAKINSSLTSLPAQVFKMCLGAGQTVTITGPFSSPDGMVVSARTIP